MSWYILLERRPSGRHAADDDDNDDYNDVRAILAEGFLLLCNAFLLLGSCRLNYQCKKFAPSLSLAPKMRVVSAKNVPRHIFSNDGCERAE